jgi:DNA-binding response OmpR family regulator
VRLLIVEDDDLVADAIARGLVAANFAVQRTASAEAALAALAVEDFDLAVIDIGLPGTDGLSLVRRLRNAGKALPTLILTARCTLADKVKALDLGADDFLSKPFEPAELAARCRANGSCSNVSCAARASSCRRSASSSHSRLPTRTSRRTRSKSTSQGCAANSGTRP